MKIILLVTLFALAYGAKDLLAQFSSQESAGLTDEDRIKEIYLQAGCLLGIEPRCRPAEAPAVPKIGFDKVVTLPKKRFTTRTPIKIPRGILNIARIPWISRIPPKPVA